MISSKWESIEMKISTTNQHSKQQLSQLYEVKDRLEYSPGSCDNSSDIIYVSWT